MRLLARSTAVLTATIVAGAFLSGAPAGALTVEWRRDAARALHGVAVDAVGTTYVAGVVRTGVRRLDTLYVAKYGSDGSRRWFDRWRPPGGARSVGHDVAIGPGGRVYVAGALLAEADDGPSGWFLRAYGPGGTTRWHRDQPGWRGREDQSTALAVAAGGDVVAIAVTSEAGRRDDGHVRAFAPDGSPLWRDPFEVPGLRTADHAVDVAADPDGAVFVVGEVDQKRRTADRPVVDQEVVVQRLGARTGNVRWTRLVRDAGRRDLDHGAAVAIHGDVLAVAARIDGGPVTGPRASRGHTWVARLGSVTGTILWERSWGAQNRRAAEPDDLAIGPGGTVHVAGSVRGGEDGVDAFVRSLGPDGARHGWTRLRAGRFQHGSGIAAGAIGGRVWVTGWRGTPDEDLPDGGRLWLLVP